MDPKNSNFIAKLTYWKNNKYICTYRVGWTACCRATATTVGGLRGARSTKLLVAVRVTAYKAMWGWALPLSPWRWLAIKSLHRVLLRTAPYEDCCGPQCQQEPCFQNEKAPKWWCGCSAMDKGRKEMILAKWACRSRLTIASFCRRMGQHRRQPRAFETACGPLGP